MASWKRLPAIVGVLLSATIPCWPTPTPERHITQRFAIGGDGGWDYVTVDAAARRLFVGRSNRVAVVNLTDGTLAGEVANTPGIHGVAIAAALKKGYTSNGGDNTVTVFDTATLHEIARVPVGTGPDAIVYDPSTKRVFTFNGESGDATVIDALHDRVVGTVALGGSPEAAVPDGRHRMFVNIADKNEIVSFDTATLAVRSRWPIAPGEDPSGLAIDTVHNRLFSVCRNGMMVVVDAKSGKVVATPPIGKGPDACAYDPASADAFSSNGQDGTLTVVHEDSPSAFRVTETVPTQRGARTMALDPTRHLIYLAAAQHAPQAPAAPNAPRRRPAIVPNSFVILVVGP